MNAVNLFRSIGKGRRRSGWNGRRVTTFPSNPTTPVRPLLLLLLILSLPSTLLPLLPIGKGRRKVGEFRTLIGK